MTKTMVQVISEHAKHGPLEDGRHGCLAKDCTQVYGVTYPEAIVVTAHVVNRLAAAGFGSRHDAWAEGFKQGGPMHDENYDDPDAHRRNPYPETR